MATTDMLTWVVRQAVNGPAAGAAPTDGLTERDWSAFLRAVVAHGLIPLTATALEALPDGAMPDELRADIRATADASARRSLQLAGELVRVIEHLEDSGISALPIKGPVLAERTYGSVVRRWFFDLDILVHRVDLPPARDLLVGLGFHPEKPMSAAQQRTYIDHQGQLEMVREADELWVELHWAIVPTYYAPPRSAGGVWLRSVEVPFGRTRVQALAPEDELEALCVHGSKHRWQRLLWVADVAMALRAWGAQFDWQVLYRRARAHGTLRMVRLGLLLADAVAGAPVPPEALADAGADQAAGRLAAEVLDALKAHPEVGVEHHDDTEREAFGFHARMRERRRDQARYLAGALFTPSGADWGRADLPAPLFPLYRLTRPIRLAITYGRRGRNER